MKKELKIKPEDIVSIKDVSDASHGKVLIALGAGALLSEKLRKVARYLIVAGVLVQLPVALRIAKKAKQLVKQFKEEQENKPETEEAPAEVETSEAAEAPVEEAPQAEGVAAEPQTEEAAPPPPIEQPEGEPANHAQEDPDD